MTTPHLVQPIDGGRLLYYAWWEQMHTRVDLLLCGEEQAQLALVAEQIWGVIHRYEAIADRFNPTSELYALNHAQGEKRVSEVLFDLLERALAMREQTEGLFDIAWASPHYTPGLASSVRLCREQLTVERGGATFDLNGFVKGVALDSIRPLLIENGVEDALVNLGNSSILALGNGPQKEGWSVAPQEGGATGITLRNECLTTSGNLVAGYTHIRHPERGEWYAGQTSLGVVTPEGWQGEVLSTALLLASPAERTTILQRFALPAEAVIDWKRERKQ